MFVVFTIIILIIGVFLCFIRGKEFNSLKPLFIRKILEFFSKKDFNEYLVNIMVVFFGVTSAIVFANFNTEKQEEKQTIDFLEDVVLTELETKAAFVTEAMIGMDVDSYFKVEIEAEGVSEDEISVEIEQKFDSEAMFETLKIYPISPVLSLDILLTDSPYKYTISRYSYSALIDCRMNFIAQKTRIDNSNSIEEMEKYLNDMAIDFYRACEIIEIEKKYQNREISEDEVKSEINKLYDELRKNENSFVIG